MDYIDHHDAYAVLENNHKQKEESLKQTLSFIFPCLTILILVTSGCASSKPQPETVETTSTPSPVSTMREADPQFTAVPRPTVTDQSSEADQTNVLVPEPTQAVAIMGSLSSPPFLLYPQIKGAKEQVVLVNQDGSGMKVIPLPEDGFSAGAPSPTGEWILFYTTANNPPEEGSINDLALHLLHLPDGRIRDVTGLLPSDYPENIQKIAELAQGNEMDFAGIPLEEITSLIDDLFKTSLFTAAWSPGGNALAFSGAMDGPSTDLYLYDLPSGKISRLSSGSRNIDFIRWFPKGDRILYGSSYARCMGDCSLYYVTNLDGSKTREIKNFDAYGGETIMGNWATESTLLVHSLANGPGICCLRNFDFEADRESFLYGDAFQTYAYDPESNILALSIDDDTIVANREPGVYFVERNGMRRVEAFATVSYLGWKDYPFILSGETTKLLSAAGTTKTLFDKGLVPFASRNNLYVALADGEWSNERNGLKIFDHRGNLMLEVKDQNISKVIWRIDSEGLFYEAGNQLFYVGLQEKVPVLIDPAVKSVDSYTEGPTFTWVR
jgi:hypothetical protein